MSSIYDFDERNRRRINFEYYRKIIHEWRDDLADILANDARRYSRMVFGPLSFLIHVYRMPNKQVEVTFYREFTLGRGGSDQFFTFNVHDAVELFPELHLVRLWTTREKGWYDVSKEDHDVSINIGSDCCPCDDESVGC